MNNIRETLTLFRLFFNSFRQSGTTGFLQRIAATSDVIILVDGQKTKSHYFKNIKDVYTINDIKNGKLNGINKKPILVDNYVLIKLFKDLESELRLKDKELINSKEALNDIANTINKYNKFKK